MTYLWCKGLCATVAVRRKVSCRNQKRSRTRSMKKEVPRLDDQLQSNDAADVAQAAGQHAWQ